MKRSMTALAAATAAATVAVAFLTAAPRTTLAADDAKKHGPIAWTESLPNALKTAAKQKKVIFIDFWAEWCGPCKMMLATTYTNKEVVAKSKQFVPVLVNVDEQQDLARKYKVSAIPTVIFLDSKGKVLGRSLGALPAPQFLKLMAEAQKKAKS